MYIIVIIYWLRIFIIVLNNIFWFVDMPAISKNVSPHSILIDFVVNLGSTCFINDLPLVISRIRSNLFELWRITWFQIHYLIGVQFNRYHAGFVDCVFWSWEIRIVTRASPWNYVFPYRGIKVRIFVRFQFYGSSRCSQAWPLFR